MELDMIGSLRTSLVRSLIPWRRSVPAFQTEAYRRHTSRRLEHLASLGLELAGKSVLEVGAGIGEHTSFYLDRGCRVLATDARPENVSALRKRFPDCRAGRLDLGAGPAPLRERFDVVHAYGLLYHVGDPESAIRFMSSCCDGMLLLETVVHPSSDGPNAVAEDARDPTQASDGFGCRPGRCWLFHVLRSHFGHVYVPITQPRHEEFPLEWDAVPPARHARAIFVCSRTPLVLPSLSDELVSRHRSQA
jgi:SAM-dependent methyltransferase